MGRRREPEPVHRGRPAAPGTLAHQAHHLRVGRAVLAALQAEPRLAGIPVEALPVARGVVELRGWVPTRAARTLAGRTALATPGIESVINSLLVRGEDDVQRSRDARATDQSA